MQVKDYTKGKWIPNIIGNCDKAYEISIIHEDFFSKTTYGWDGLEKVILVNSDNPVPPQLFDYLELVAKDMATVWTNEAQSEDYSRIESWKYMDNLNREICKDFMRKADEAVIAYIVEQVGRELNSK